ncbi:hypothetical protein RhiirA4_465904 [Rhizophagus irregularis]|uniref:Uncharacterized protein n=1 Tax=Rhizophagus irregularis TaxID=588596 RepID=A0A2I1GT17_9GLOM|nr:hypothetical protein RhiirA4_465904 [Rhizophagus irregularis]
MGRWNDQDLDYAGSGQGVDGKDKAYPTMMIEVGFSQSLPDLHQIAALYFNRRTIIQIVLTIKIFGKRINTNTNTSTIALISTLYLRTSTTPLILTSVISSFLLGQQILIQNIVNYIINQMGVPSGFPIVPNTPPAGFAAGFNLDLWEVQDIIRRHI